jgi:hypothetical protein
VWRYCQRKRCAGAGSAKPIGAGVIGGLVGALVGAVMRDAKVAAISLVVFTLSSISWYYHLVYDHFDMEWRVVYVRP